MCSFHRNEKGEIVQNESTSNIFNELKQSVADAKWEDYCLDYREGEKIELLRLKHMGVKTSYDNLSGNKDELLKNNTRYNMTWYRCTLNHISVTVGSDGMFDSMVNKFLMEYDKIREKYNWENMES